MSAITHRGVTSEITAWHGSYLNGLPRTDYSAVVSYDEGGVKISAEKHWITTRSEAEAIVAKYRARWERPCDDERTEPLGHCVLCGKQSEARVEDAPADAVNDDIIAGNMIHRIPGNPCGVCAACAHDVTYYRACACEWIHPGGHLSSGMRLTILLHRLNSLSEEPASYALNRLLAHVEPEILSHFEREMDREEERQRTAARNAAIAWDANHDCREQR